MAGFEAEGYPGDFIGRPFVGYAPLHDGHADTTADLAIYAGA